MRSLGSDPLQRCHPVPATAASTVTSCPAHWSALAKGSNSDGTAVFTHSRVPAGTCSVNGQLIKSPSLSFVRNLLNKELLL